MKFRTAAKYIAFLLFPFVFGCNVTKYLGPDDGFLVENEITILKDKKLNKDADINADLYNLFLQKPNDKFLGIPKQYFYYKYGMEADSSAFKNWVNKQFGQTPVVFNDSIMENTAINISNYLHNRGYFEAEVQGIKIFKDRKGKKLKAVYEIDPGVPYTISEIDIFSKDSIINDYLNVLEKSSLLSAGNRLDQNLYNQECQRISQILKDEGYALFGTHFIDNLKVDSTNNEFKVSMEVLKPANAEKHHKYTIGNITIFPDYDPTVEGFVKRDTIGKGIYLLQQNERLIIRKEVLLDAVSFESGDEFSQTKMNQTNRKLGQLEMYGFVNIKRELDPYRPNTLNLKIYLTPNKRFAFGANGELNMSRNGNEETTLLRLFGVSSNISLQHRNLLRGAELFVTSLEAGMALNVKNPRDSLVNNLDIHAKMDLYFPKFVDYLGLWGTMNKIGFVNTNAFNRIKRNSKTHLALAYDNILNFQFFRLHSFNTSYGYEIEGRKNRKLSINMLGLDYFNPSVTERFVNEVFSQSAYLESSFTKQFFTGFLFRDLNFKKVWTNPKYRETRTLGWGVEVSGMEILAANALYNRFNQMDNTVVWSIKTSDTSEPDIKFSQYIKSYLSYTYTKKYNNKTSVAFRAISGIAKPLGYSNSIPFVKQFYVGGPESMRGWLARSVGPGGVRAENGANSFVQSGDIHLEFNMEYRMPLFTLSGILYESAIFLDMGNVWLLYPDEERPQSQLTLENFYKHNAVNTGLGLRLDFTYFILRLDMGIRLRNPYSTIRDGQETYWKTGRQVLKDRPNFNLALGYPF